MFDKESKDRKYRENPYRAENFHIAPDGVMHCPNGKAFHFRYRKNVKGNKYGRQEEVFECEDCSGCPYASECKKTPKNRTVRINQELTAMHREVLDNLNSVHGALLRMNRSIQAEGTFGVMFDADTAQHHAARLFSLPKIHAYGKICFKEYF